MNIVDCPYCDHEQDAGDYHEFDEEEHIEDKCDKCGEEFTYQWYSIICFKSFK